MELPSKAILMYLLILQRKNMILNIKDHKVSVYFLRPSESQKVNGYFKHFKHFKHFKQWGHFAPEN